MAIRSFHGGFGGTRRPRRRVRRNRPRWTADFADFTIAAGALAQQVIVSELDFGTSTTLESEALLLRIVGGIDTVPTTAGASIVNVGIATSSEFAIPTFGTAIDPALVDSLIDDDWLWVDQFVTVLDADGGFISRHIDKDIRVKRKLKSGDVLRFVATNLAGGVSVDISAWFRILLEPRL